MTSSRSKHRVSARFAAGIAISALFALGTFVATASADDHHRDGDRERHYDRGHDGWDGGYYREPPVVYGAPYYAPPPVVYGPSIGVYLPGVSIGIR